MRGRVRWQVIMIHKCTGITIGVLVGMGLMTGIFLLIPTPGLLAPTSISYDIMTVSPAQAAVVARAHADGHEIRNLSLRQLGGGLLYQVNLVGSGAVLVDGQSGAVVQITDSLVMASVRKRFGADVEIDRMEYLERRTLSYLFGPLPAYRVEIGDRARSVVHVAVRDGRLRASTGRSRLVGAIGAIHTIEALRIVRIGQRGERRLLILTSSVSSILVMTGYLLTLPVRRSPRR